MHKALITGAAGFCASHLARRLRAIPDMQLVGWDVRNQPPAGVPLSEYRRVDMADSRQVHRALERLKPDLVFHLAGQFRGPAQDVHRTNLVGGLNLLEAVRSSVPDARVLVTGTAAEYGNVSPEELPIREDCCCRPRGAYAVSKHALTLSALAYARDHRLRVVVARPFNIIGPGIPSSLVVGALLDRAKRALDTPGTSAVPAGNLDTVRDFLAVEDAVSVYVRLLELGIWGEIFNVCSGRPRTIRSIAEQLLSYSPRPLCIESEQSLCRPLDVPAVYGNPQKLQQLVGFQAATDLDAVLRSTWYHHMSAHQYGSSGHASVNASQPSCPGELTADFN